MRLNLLLIPLLFACNPDTDEPVDDTDDDLAMEETEGIEGCDNLLPDCFYPFPSGATIDTSGDRPRFKLPPEATPLNSAGERFDTSHFEAFTGFGTASPILFRWEGAADPNLPILDPTPSLASDAVTVLIDAATGERIPHWVETDYLADEADPPVFTLRPSIPLPRGTTIVVGLRGWTDAAGDVLEAPAPFAALRDAEPTPWRGIHARRAHFDEVVFPTLAEAGFEREELQLAWSFPTQSVEESTRNLLDVRDAVFAALPADGPDYTLVNVVDCTDPTSDPMCPGIAPIRVLVDGIAHVPSAMLPTDDRNVRRIRRDDDGNVVIDGTEDWPFRLQIPHSAYEGDEPVSVMQYGHGFMGWLREGNNGWIRDMAERKRFAILSTSMQGMTSHPRDPDGFPIGVDDPVSVTVWIGILLNQGGRMADLAELSLQGVTNQLVMQRMMATSLADDDHPAFYRDDERLAWDPDDIWYYGNSQGGSVGTLVMGTSLDVRRGVLGVPGSGYPFLLHRSVVFTTGYLDVIAAAYADKDAASKLLALLGTAWNMADPLTFAPHIHGNPLPGTPDHEALLHVAKEDQQVANEPSFILGRAANAVLMTPAVRPVFGLPEQPYPASPGAAVVEVDFGIPEDPDPRTPPPTYPELPNNGDTHGWLRAWYPAQDQMVHFLRTGEMIDVCDGEPCFHDGKP